MVKESSGRPATEATTFFEFLNSTDIADNIVIYVIVTGFTSALTTYAGFELLRLMVAPEVLNW